MQSFASGENRPNRDWLFELCSRSIDNDLTEDEIALLADLRRQSESESAQFESDCQQIRSLMRSIAPRPVPEAFANQVAKRLSAAPRARVMAASSDHPPGRRHRRFVTGVSLSTLAACLLLVVLSQVSPDRGQPLSERAPDPGRGDIATAGIAAPAASADDSAVELARADTDVAESPESNDEPPVLSEGTDWQVVVLRIPDTDQDAAMGRIARFIGDYGLELQAQGETPPRQSPGDYGFILTRSSGRSTPFADALVNAGLAESSVWNPDSAAAMNREELQRIARSMLSPTASELHFGRMYLAVPRGTPSAEEPKAMAGALPDTRSADRAAAADTAQDSPDPVEPADVTEQGERQLADAAGNSGATASVRVPPDSNRDLSPESARRSSPAAVAPSAPAQSSGVKQGYVLVVLEFAPPEAEPDCAPDASPL